MLFSLDLPSRSTNKNHQLGFQCNVKKSYRGHFDVLLCGDDIKRLCRSIRQRHERQRKLDAIKQLTLLDHCAQENRDREMTIPVQSALLRRLAPVCAT
jgi:hypothetical protein